MNLIALLTGIALVDSLNPTLFVVQFYLFTTPKPMPRIASYIAGVVTANYVGGVLLLVGLGTVIANLIAQIPPVWLTGFQIVLGVVLFIFGLIFRAEAMAESETIQKPRSMGLIAAFVFGIVVMAQELTTALPYFFAIERIVDARPTLIQSLLALGLYNLVFVLPLLVFMILFARLRHRISTQLERVTLWIRKWVPRLMKAGALIVGTLLMVSGVTQFIGNLVVS